MHSPCQQGVGTSRGVGETVSYVGRTNVLRAAST